MNVYKKLKNERKDYLYKILLPLLLMAVAGYFLRILILEDFFIGWELYFAVGCYLLILLILLVIDIGMLRWLWYDIYIEDRKVKIKDGFFSRPISMPIERLYYINSIKLDKDISYDSIFITDKKVNHKKVSPLSENELCDSGEHLNAVRYLKDRYPDKRFYYYRISHHGYRFIYYFYMIYKVCERCRFSDGSMELVKKYAEGK